MTKTKPPLVFYLNYFAAVVVLILLIASGAGLGKTLFYTMFAFFAFYILFTRDACTISIRQNQLFVNYLFPWQKNKTIPLNGLKEVDYRKGFFDFFSSKGRTRYSSFPNYCSDLITLKYKDSTINEEVNVECNTRMFEFDKIINELAKFTQTSK